MLDSNGHLDTEGVFRQMVAACQPLQAILDEDAELIRDVPHVEVAWIVKALAAQGDESCISRVMDVAEQVLRDFGQEGRDFIGAGLIEAIPDSDEARFRDFAGQLTIALMNQILGRPAEK